MYNTYELRMMLSTKVQGKFYQSILHLCYEYESYIYPSATEVIIYSLQGDDNTRISAKCRENLVPILNGTTLKSVI